VKIFNVKSKIKIDNFAMAIVMFLVCATLISIIFIQFKTIEETEITDIENMREAELRTTLSEWKTKYEEANEKLAQTNKTIKEYNEKIDKNEEASGLIDKELQQSNLVLGKTDVYGEGVVVTLSDNKNEEIYAYDLIELVNELRYAGAEAISINDIRVINTTEIVDLNDYMSINVDGRRLSSPYVVKAIGNQTYLSSILNLKDSGFIDKYTNSGYTVKCENRKKVEILKYSNDMAIRYLEEVEEEQKWFGSQLY